MLPSRAVNEYYIILNVNLIHRLHYVWFRNFPDQVNILVCIRRQSEFIVNSTHKFCAVDIILNITRHQAISPVPKFHHVLRRGFMI